jgi:hydroxymethylbilane synthase
MAGVKRLGFESRITEIIPTEISLPAIGQGALGIETRKGDKEVEERIHFLDDPPSATAVSAERAFLKKLEGGCQVPIAAFARIVGSMIHMEGLVGTVDGQRLIRHHLEGTIDQGESLGTELAETLLKKGAKEILEEVYQRSAPVISIEERNNG